ncbi:MAG: type II toxin-antitoxin system prevent-host-death family antitoxin [Acidobacteria bacterium]|nr:type II toxin-antitoxin system prevent-host-death family antitoxin [Acidobacteriota bacterium]
MVLQKVRNNFSEVIEGLEKTGPVLVTKNGKGRALLIPVYEDTDIETLMLSQQPAVFGSYLRRLMCKLPTPHCHGCQQRHDSRGPLHSIARWPSSCPKNPRAFRPTWL